MSLPVGKIEGGRGKGKEGEGEGGEKVRERGTPSAALTAVEETWGNFRQKCFNFEGANLVLPVHPPLPMPPKRPPHHRLLHSLHFDHFVLSKFGQKIETKVAGILQVFSRPAEPPARKPGTFALEDRDLRVYNCSPAAAAEALGALTCTT